MIIVDDPVEPDSQASRETREAVWKWFKLTREQELNDIDTVYGEPKMIRVVDDPQWSPEQLAEITGREHEGLMSAPTVDEFAEAVRELLEYADGMSLKTGVRFDKLLLRHELGKPEPDQAAVKRLTEEIAFAENYGKQD